MSKFPHWLLVIGLTPSVWAEVVVDPAQPITHRVQVQPIRVFKSSAAANTFGSSATENYIKLQINRIYAQIGVRIDWLAFTEYTNDFAYDGSPGNYYTPPARPTDHLATIVDTAPAPPKSGNAVVINMFFVKIVPGFTLTSENTSNGLAFIDSNGVTMHVGGNLLTGSESQKDLIARVIAHEIGHNLGLEHYTASTTNLMASGGTTGRLVGAQKTIAFTNHIGIDSFDFLQPLPPATNYSTWASTNNVLGGPGDDDDLDGLDNLIEFMFQKNPKQSDQLPQPVAAANGLTWTLPKHAPAVADGIVYRVTTSDTLTSWLPAGSDSGRSTVLQNDASALVVRLLSGGSKRFMRLDIDIPVALGADASTFIPLDEPSHPRVISEPVDIMTMPEP